MRKVNASQRFRLDWIFWAVLARFLNGLSGGDKSTISFRSILTMTSYNFELLTSYTPVAKMSSPFGAKRKPRKIAVDEDEEMQDVGDTPEPVVKSQSPRSPSIRLADLG